MAPTSPVSVVRLDADDWESYRELRIEMLLDAPEAFWTTHAEVVDRDETQWRQAFTPHAHCLQARDADQVPVGTAVVLLPPDPAAHGLAAADALLLAVYVRPRARGAGVGDALLEAAEQLALDELGAARLLLHVSEINHPALALYARHGYTPTGQTIAHPRLAGVNELELATALR